MEIATGIFPPKQNIAFIYSSNATLPGIFGLEAYGALRSEILPISNNKDIVKLLLDPHSISKFGFSYKFFTRTMYCSNCFTLEVIWNLRNQVEHNDSQINIMTSINSMEHKVTEIMSLIK